MCHVIQQTAKRPMLIISMQTPSVYCSCSCHWYAWPAKSTTGPHTHTLRQTHTLGTDSTLQQNSDSVLALLWINSKIVINSVAAIVTSLGLIFWAQQNTAKNPTPLDDIEHPALKLVRRAVTKDRLQCCTLWAQSREVCNHLGSITSAHRPQGEISGDGDHAKACTSTARCIGCSAIYHATAIRCDWSTSIDL